MEEAPIFYHPRNGYCPIYIQEDAAPGLTKPLKDIVENFGGIVLENVENAVVIVIVRQNTRLGSTLVAEYSGETSGKCVVDQAWILDSIKQGYMLGPPDWGGHLLRRHTSLTFFADAPEDNRINPDARYLESRVTQRSPLISVRETSLHPLGPSNSTHRLVSPQVNRFQSAISQDEGIPTPQRILIPQRVSQDSRGSTVPIPRSVHFRHVEQTSDGSSQVGSNSALSIPTDKEKQPMGVSGKFYFTDKEKAFIRARFEQALLSKTLKPLQLFAKISKEIPWHSPRSIESYIRKKDWLKELKVLPVRTADRNRSHRETNASNSEAEVNLPIANRTDGGVPYSSPEEPDNDSDHSQGEMRSVIEAPPKAPPRHDFSRHTGTTYTVTDREFIIDYLAWAERNNIKSSSSVLAGMHELMPWHSQQSISSFVHRHPHLFGKRNIQHQLPSRPLGRAGLEYRLRETEAEVARPSSIKIGPPKRKKSHLSPRKSAGKEGTLGTREPAEGATSAAKGKAPSSLNEATIEAMIQILKKHPEAYWAPTNSPQRHRIWSKFAKLNPSHSTESYYQYHKEHHKDLEARANQLLQDELYADDQLEHELGGGVEAIVDRLIERGKLEALVLAPLPRLHRGQYGPKDCLVVIQFLADNPTLFYGSIQLAQEATNYKNKAIIWEKLAAKFNTRTPVAWREFHRINKAPLERAARKLIAIRQARESGVTFREPGPSSGTPSRPSSGASGSGEGPTTSQASGSPHQSFKRPIQGGPESSGPSKRMRFEEN